MSIQTSDLIIGIIEWLWTIGALFGLIYAYINWHDAELDELAQERYERRGGPPKDKATDRLLRSKIRAYRTYFGTLIFCLVVGITALLTPPSHRVVSPSGWIISFGLLFMEGGIVANVYFDRRDKLASLRLIGGG